MRSKAQAVGLLLLILVLAGACSTARAQPTGPGSPAYALALEGPAIGENEWVTARTELAGGDYVLEWSAGPPFRGEFGSCGSRFGSCQVVVRLLDAKGDRVDGSPSLPDIYIDAAAAGSVRLAGLEPGEYHLDIQVSCPWRVTLRPA